MKPNLKVTPSNHSFDGFLSTGVPAAKTAAVNDLRRATLTALLWEDVAYKSGLKLFEEIDALIPKVTVFELTGLIRECRHVSKLRHTPLYLLVKGMQVFPTLPVQALIVDICTRLDMLTDMVALYWELNPKRTNGKNAPLSKQMRLGIATVLANANEYSLAKYNELTRKVKMRDLLFLSHPKVDEKQQELFNKLIANTLQTPDTWEVELSKSQDKKASWERLLTEKKLGALAFMRNLRNMESVNVNRGLITSYFNSLNAEMLMPANYLTAWQNAPSFKAQIERLMFRGFENATKLPGHTVFIVDVSGSMGYPTSTLSTVNRMDQAITQTILAYGLCEKVTIVCTAGSDAKGIGAHEIIQNPVQGFDLSAQIMETKKRIGSGGIFTRQAIDFIKSNIHATNPVDRVMVFSDSVDCDRKDPIPKLFAKLNYIINIAPDSKGINYNGKWTAEISGASTRFVQYCMALEGLEVAVE